MGIEIGRIEREFILSSLRKKAIPVKIHGDKKWADGSITQIEDELLEIVLDESPAAGFADGENVRIFFSYYGHVMTFNTAVRRAGAGVVILRPPSSVYRDLQRKYERVPPPMDSSLEFVLQDSRIMLSFPKSQTYEAVEKPAASPEFDPRSIEELIHSFKAKMQSSVGSHRIVMFRERKPESLEEELIAHTGKILYMPKIDGLLPEEEGNLKGRIITRAMLLGAGNDVEDSADGLVDRLPSMIAQKREQMITAELYCPILYERYTVGYIHLRNSSGDDFSIDPELVEYVYQFSRVLSYALEKNGYFMGIAPEGGQYSAQIIDISASGLLFVHSSKQLHQTLLLYTDLDIVLTIGPKRIQIGSRVMRKFEDGSNTFYGLQYLEIKPEDFKFLFDYVYGRSFTENDSEKWEGGAAPPALNLD